MILQPHAVALFFTVALLAVTAYFLLGSVPLLVLKHDNPVDARFIRSFYLTYYRIALVAAVGTAISYALAGRPAFAAGAGGIAALTLVLRGKFIPIVPIGNVITAQGAVSQPTEGVLIVVDTESTGQAALLVDNICDQRQFVIKSLDTHYRSVEGVAGATILGDGRVALILDIDGLVARSCQPAPLQREAA